MNPDATVRMEVSAGDTPPVVASDAIDDPAVRELMVLTGRKFSDLGLRTGGTRVLGQMTLLEVHTWEPITLLPGDLVPAGIWVPENHIHSIRALIDRRRDAR